MLHGIITNNTSYTPDTFLERGQVTAAGSPTWGWLNDPTGIPTMSIWKKKNSGEGGLCGSLRTLHPEDSWQHTLSLKSHRRNPIVNHRGRDETPTEKASARPVRFCVWAGEFGVSVVGSQEVSGEGGFESEIPFPEHSLLPVRLQQRLLLPRCKSKLSLWPSEVREAFSRNSKQVSELQD